MVLDARINYILETALCALSVKDPLHQIREDFMNRQDGDYRKIVENFIKNIPPSDVDTFMAISFHKEEVIGRKLYKVKVPVSEESCTDNTLAVRSGETSVSNSRVSVRTISSANRISSARSKVSAISHDGNQGDVKEDFRYKVLIQTYTYDTLHVMEGCPTEDQLEELKIDSFFYLVRANVQDVPKPTSEEEAIKILPSSFITGYVHRSDYIMTLSPIMNLIFGPMLSYVGQLDQIDKEAACGRRKSAETDQVRKTDRARDEFSVSLHRFNVMLNDTIESLTGSFKLPFPNLELISENESRDVKNNRVIRVIEATVRDWNHRISRAVKVLKKKIPDGNSPLEEVRFWRHRTNVLTSILEQLRLKPAQHVLRLWERIAGEPFSRPDVESMLTEAKDNLRFMVLVERHFKNLVFGLNFQVLIDTIPPMMSSLRFIWIISRSYNKDELMGPLLKRIAWALIDRMTRVLEVKSLFNQNMDVIMFQTQQAIHIIELWKKTYFQERMEVEKSSRDNRWEFDRAELFGKTDHLAMIFKNFYEIAKSAHEFYTLFGPELKSITGEAKRLDVLTAQVDKIPEIIKSDNFAINPLERKHLKEWEAVMAVIRYRLVDIDKMAVNFVHEYFRNIRSVMDAFDLLEKLRNLRLRKAITSMVDKKYEDICAVFSSDISMMKRCFEENKDKVPFRYAPPTGGNTAWIRHILCTMKAHILRFLEVGNNVLETETGKALKQKYLDFGRILRDYETTRHHEWYEEVTHTLPELLRRPVLAVATAVTTSSNYRPSTRMSIISSNTDLTLRQALDCVLPKYEVNFDTQITEYFTDARYCENLGLEVPELLRVVAIQAKRYNELQYSLRQVVNEYNDVVDRLDIPTANLLDEHLQKLHHTMNRGSKYVTWNSLVINEFINDCKRVIKIVDGKMNEIKAVEQNIEYTLQRIASINLFKISKQHKRGNYPTVKDYLEYAESKRVDDMMIVGRCRIMEIQNKLEKLEEIVFKTKTGRSPRLLSYYNKYEMRILMTALKMLIRNIYTFINAFGSDFPLFCVDVKLASCDIVTFPSPLDIHKWIHQTLRDCVDCTKFLTRWKAGTCQTCPPIKIPKQDEPFIFSYRLDIERSVVVHDAIAGFTSCAQKVLKRVNSTMQRIYVHRKFWRLDKAFLIEKWASKNHAPRDFEQSIINMNEKFQEIEEAVQGGKNKKVGSIVLRLQSFYHSMQIHRLQWLHLYLRILREGALQKTKNIQTKIADYEAILDKMPKDIEDLKVFLGAIREIFSGMTEMIDSEVSDIRERYRIIKLYGDEEFNENISESEFNTDHLIAQKWKFIVEKCHRRLVEIGPTKEKFAVQVRHAVKEFRALVADFIRRFKESGPGVVTDDLNEGLQIMERFDKEFAELDKQRKDLVTTERLLDLPISHFKEMKIVGDELADLRQIYQIYEDQMNVREDWSLLLWSNLDINKMINGMEKFLKNFANLPQYMRVSPAGKAVQQNMINFKESLPLLADLKHEALRIRHWQTLMKETGISFQFDRSSFTLQNVFAMELYRYHETIETILADAIRELKIENTLAQMEDVWKENKFKIVPYINIFSNDGFLVGEVDELRDLLDDNMMTLQAMASSRYVTPFVKTVRRWEKLLSLVYEVLDELLIVQRKWMYLEAIFVGGDIKSQMPKEAKRFLLTDRGFKRVMKDIYQNPNILKACEVHNRYRQLQEFHNELDWCQKALNDYLYTKRNAFPRFFFISDDELLSILGTTDPKGVQEHIIKMFDNIEMLIFDEETVEFERVVGMESSEGERMPFRQHINVEGNLETWMTEVEGQMRETNRYLTKEAIFYYRWKKARIDWMFDYQGMMVLAANEIWFTWEVEDTFRKIKSGKRSAMKDFYKAQKEQLNQIVIRVRAKLSPNDRKKLETVLIIDIHSRDMVDYFVKNSISAVDEFEWESQLRFYWVYHEDGVMVRQCNGEFRYGYEYMGLNGRLVVTPLTDRIYLTLTQALTMNLGGAPEGPAGTGKTETCKDLAKAMGTLCIVTNCGEGLDYKSFGKLLNGLCQCGAWGCFDEFNRIDLSVLSVVSMQIFTIQSALSKKLAYFNLEDKEIRLDSRVGLFITMNPGYAGRSELPESIKLLFRPVVVIVPDFLQICEVMLFSQGFLSGKLLARKMTTMYKVASEQLSKQHHYDFGLRALKSVLIMAGSIRRHNPEYSEEKLIMRALRDSNLPKFIFDDVALFHGLVQDLFPNIECPTVVDTDLVTVIEEYLTENNYAIVEAQVDKILQLRHTMDTRHSIMVVGPTSGGKTVVIQTLVESKAKLGESTRVYRMNPKERDVSELYGTLDPDSRDWKDGLLSHLFRMMNNPQDRDYGFRSIIFDGDVDAMWIENMNSVMDDNRLLTLINGERIRLLPNCFLLFEVSDLQYASPATVTRCGMVYVDPQNLCFYCIWERWLRSRSEREEGLLTQCYQKFIPLVMDAIFEGIMGGKTGKPMKTVVFQSPINVINQLCTMMTSLLKMEPRGVYDLDLMEAYFICAIINSAGLVLHESETETFHSFLYSIANLTSDSKEEFTSYGFLPTEKPLNEYTFEAKRRKWIPWDALIPDYTYDRNQRFSSILVPTADTVRTIWLLNRHWNVKKPLILIGDTGTTKSASVKQFLSELDTETNKALRINCTSRTSAFDLQHTLESHTEKRTKDSYGPPTGKSLVVFIDDLSMPQRDSFGTQQPIAFLRQLIEMGYMYDRSKDLDIRYMRDLIYFAAMARPGGGRQHVTQRLISHFSVMHCHPPSKESLFRIFNSILSGHTQRFSEDVQSIVENITTMTIELYNHVKEAILPTPAKFHYVYNLRDISRIYQGLCLSSCDRFDRADKFLRLWYHECQRCLADRMIASEDVAVVVDKVTELIKREYAKQPESENYILREPLIFGDYACATEEGSLRLYEDILDYTAVRALFEEIQTEYNEKDPATATLVLFHDALNQISRLHRVLRINKGHLLVVGIPGCGKSVLLSLAAYAAGTSKFEIKLKKTYREREFREDLKSLYRKIAAERAPVVFVVDDQEITEEGFLGLINTMLTSGIIPALFNDDEWNELCNDLRPLTAEAGYPSDNNGAWRYFTALVNDNLHIAMTMSPGGDNLRTRCRNFPAIVNNTTITWFYPWPHQALLEVAGNLVSVENPLVPIEHWQNIIGVVVYIHESVEKNTIEFKRKLRRENHVTPTHYIDFLNTYVRLLKERDEYVNKQIIRLSNGLEKLQETGKEIDILNVQVAKQKKTVEEKTIACKVLMEEIEVATKSANATKVVVSEKSAEMKVRTKEIVKEKAEAEEVLAEALPAVEAAQAALSELEKNDVTEMRAFATPPRAVQSVGEMLCHIFQNSDVSWKSARGIMSDASFISTLQQMDVEAIPSRCINSIREIIKSKNVRVEDVRAASKAGAGILKFVLAVLSYYNVAREVRPKRERVRMLERDMMRAEKELERANQQLSELAKQLKYLRDRYDSAQEDMDRLRKQMAIMKRRLKAAEQLTQGLASEEIRWSVDLAELKMSRKYLVGDCLLAAAFLSYLGPFTWEYRNRMLYEDWMTTILKASLPHSDEFRVEKLLTTEVEISKWNSEGLPPDELSIQNGILSLRGSRFPICIDPHQQALSWIKRSGKEEPKNIRISTFENPNFTRGLENSVKYGNYFLFENCGVNIDPLIDNVLTQNLTIDKGRKTVILADKEVDWDDRFRLFLTTKIANPPFLPKIFTKALVINYTVTLKGLEDQLLCVLVKIERKDIEETRERLIHDTSVNKRMLKEFEDRLLLELATQTGNILDNQELIDALEETKRKAVQVQKQLTDTVEMAKAIEIQRDGFRPAAKRGALLFFILADMSIINPMYQFSLSAYLSVFCNAIKKSTPCFSLDKRQKSIVQTLTYHVYCYGCTGIFERHKLFFSFLLTSKLQLDQDILRQNEFEFFIKGNVSLESPKEENPFEWISHDNWRNLVLLAQTIPNTFGALIKNIKKRKTLWKEWYDEETPERRPFPTKYSRLRPFHKLCLLRCLRLDRVCNAIVGFITMKMGEKFVSPPILNFTSVYESSASHIPVVFILSPGSDPAAELLKLAGRMKFPTTKIKFQSLGQGQEPIAEAILETSMAHGYWLILQNCHLLISWLGYLEGLFVEGIKCHPDFRLWLTTEPTKRFPIGLLQKSFKVVTEPPTGLKLNLDATYNRLTNAQLVECPHPAFRPLVFALAFLHAVLQERRRYGKIGWNVYYDFNESDFAVSYRIMQTYLTKAWNNQEAGEEAPIPWGSLKFLIGEVMYGGRVIDFYDRRVLTTYMSEYFGDFLFDDCQIFSFYENEKDRTYYYIPEELALYALPRDAYTEYIKHLPLNQSPEALGLHANAVIGYNTSMARDICSWMIDMMPRKVEASSESTVSSEDVIQKTASGILELIPPLFDINGLRKKTVILNPTRVVLFQELERYNLLIEKMKKTLENLMKAIAGETTMSQELENVSNSLYNGLIPVSWRRLTPETRKSLGNWMTFFTRRCSQYEFWIESNDLFCIWLSGLHVPESYLTALIQQACRRRSWALDRCSLVATVTEHSDFRRVSAKPEFGCNLYGIYMEGAAWNIEKCELERQKPKQLIQDMPVLRLTPTEVHRIKLAEKLRVPVYVTSQRRNAMGVGHVFDVDLHTTVHMSHWILQGVALLLNED